MGKWFGNIGFAQSQEIRPGVWKDIIIERPYYGDVPLIVGRNKTTDKVSDDITIQNTISIVADPFARENFYSMKYLEYEGTKWKITSVEVQYPRLKLTTGGLYNGKD